MQYKTVFFVVATKGRVNSMLRQRLFRFFCNDGWHIVIFSPFSNDPAFRGEFGGDTICFENLIPMGAWAKRVAYVRAAAMREMHPLVQGAYYIRRHATRGFRKNTFVSVLKQAFIQALAYLIPPPLKRNHTFWEYCMRLTLSPLIAKVFIEQYKPNLIVLASAGAEGNDVPHIVAGNHHHIPTLAIDSNIDAAINRYSVAPWRISHWALFSDIQKKEFHELHNIPDENMTVTGALRYDHYFGDFKPASREEFCKKISVDSSKKIITLGAKTPIVFPHNENIITMVQGAIKEGRYGNAELYVRFDPGHDISRYSSEFLKTFIWERAEQASGGEHIANLLVHSAVYVGLCASTLAIEACAVGTPALWVGFDGTTHYKDDRDSCRSRYTLPVFDRIIKTGGIPLVESEEELLSTIQQYIEHSDFGNADRRRMLAQEYANAEDGRAAERIFALVQKLVQ